ncbi:hypothetical protein HHI36_008728 [Cryptolaemus montrouzieri]|uniref:Uncharacterized protein n=1 Tax=Cryptolaemus montrouzieri TaxID=559131 RepID=A0ABD2MTU7_9CUCU
MKQTADLVLGYKQKNRKEWIQDETWGLIEQRKDKKKQDLTSRIRSEKEERRKQYQDLSKRVKRSARRDKKEWTDQLIKEAQNVA